MFKDHALVFRKWINEGRLDNSFIISQTKKRGGKWNAWYPWNLKTSVETFEINKRAMEKLKSRRKFLSIALGCVFTFGFVMIFGGIFTSSPTFNVLGAAMVILSAISHAILQIIFSRVIENRRWRAYIEDEKISSFHRWLEKLADMLERKIEDIVGLEKEYLLTLADMIVRKKMRQTLKEQERYLELKSQPKTSMTKMNEVTGSALALRMQTENIFIELSNAGLIEGGSSSFWLSEEQSYRAETSAGKLPVIKHDIPEV